MRPTVVAALTAVLVAAGLATAHPAAASWTADTTIGTGVVVAPGSQQDAQAVSDERGGMLLLWSDTRSGVDTDLYCQRVSAGGDSVWGSGGVAATTGFGQQFRSMLIADGKGGAFAGWMDLGALGYRFQHFGPNGVARWRADGVTSIPGFDSNFGPKICRDTLGGIFVAHASGSPGTMIQRLDSLGNKVFSAAGALLHANPASPGAIMSDGSGGAVAAVLYGSPGDLVAQRVTQTGTFLWGSGASLCVATGGQGQPDVVSDGVGGFFFAWVDSRAGSTSDIYAQRVSAAGTLLWTTDGIAVCTAAGNQTAVRLRAEPDGSVVVVWRDDRASPAASIYAQRIRADGTMAWAPDGVVVCASSSLFERFSVASDTGDTTFVAWNTSAGFGGDVFAQKLDGDGLRQWGDYGATVCRATADLTGSACTSDGLGGLFVAYSDPRSGNRDLYATRLGPAGTPGAPPTVDVPWIHDGPRVLAGVPNPARGAQRMTFARPLANGTRIDIIDVSGRVRVARGLAAGATSWTWDGLDDDGARVEPGVYFVRAVSGDAIAVARWVRVQ
jgi:hypothetical protein